MRTSLECFRDVQTLVGPIHPNLSELINPNQLQLLQLATIELLARHQ